MQMGRLIQDMMLDEFIHVDKLVEVRRVLQVPNHPFLFSLLLDPKKNEEQ